jgi:hypothetical protein
MAIYGTKGAYFNTRPQGFINSIWIELIGFDNTEKDFGAGRFLDGLGFTPDIVSFHLTSLDGVNTHSGMEKEYLLPVYMCSYGGHGQNDDRERQDWTNYQMRGLVDALHRRGVRIYSSFFDLESPSGRDFLPRIFSDDHPELRCVSRDGLEYGFLYMTKRFADGRPYADFLIPRLVQFAQDYGLDGIQLADGISSPRVSLDMADYSDDLTGRFLRDVDISLPQNIPAKCQTKEEFRRRSDWIYNTHRLEWIRFNTGEWRSFMTTVIKTLRQNGIEAAFNSAWTKDPLVSIYRYGTDYKAYEKAGANNFVVEDVSAMLFMLADEENGYHMSYEDRVFVHYEFLANLMCNKAHLPELPLTPLSMIRDTLEQWDSLHHAPTAMQRSTASNLNTFVYTPQGPKPVTSGPWFCLGDGLSINDWDEIRSRWDNGYTPYVCSVPGYALYWSPTLMEKELEGVVKDRLWHSSKWLSELLRHGAPVHAVVPAKYLEYAQGNLLVPNPALIEREELEALLSYRKGNLAFIGLVPDGLASGGKRVVSQSPWQTVSFVAVRANIRGGIETFQNDTPRPANVEALEEPGCGAWPHPMNYHPVAQGFLDRCAEILTEACGYPRIEGNAAARNIIQINIDENTDRFLIDNDEYYYQLPSLQLKGEIESVTYITKPSKYPARLKRQSIGIRVPGRGMDIFEIHYKK